MLSAEQVFIRKTSILCCTTHCRLTRSHATVKSSTSGRMAIGVEDNAALIRLYDKAASS